MNREVTFLRTFAITAAAGMLFLATSAFKNNSNHNFTEINVERINIVEKDGTVKMIITNTARFPNDTVRINGRATNESRKQRSGMLFFNEDGIECGGFIYDGQRKGNGHSSGLSLTYDQYDGDQVMQLLTRDYKEGDQRFVSSTLAFNDRPAGESQLRTMELMKELDSLRTIAPEIMEAKYKEYESRGWIGGVPRIMLGKSGSRNNGLFLFDDTGKPRAMLFVDKDNNARLEFYDGRGQTIATFPERK